MALLSVVLAGLGFAGILAPPVYAQQRPPAQATQHALDELANCIAQGKCTLTPTPSPTRAPAATPTVAPSATEVQPTDIPATPTPLPGLPFAEDASNAYLRPAPDPWVELALPTGRWLVQSSCSLSPWTSLSYRTDVETHYAYLNDCVLTVWQWVSETQCAENDDGDCDLDYDLSYFDYLGSLPSPTPTALVVGTLSPALPSPRPPTAPPAPRAAAPVQAAPAYIVVTATPVPDDAVTPRPTIRPSATTVPTRTATTPASATVIRTPTPTETEVLVAAAESPSPLPRLPFDWTGVFVVLGVLSAVGATTTWLVIRQRRHHLAQLAELENLSP